MGCGTGCTDCPTCRGELLPDAPVMKDMGFAMAMAQGPLYEDRFLGPLSVAQTVRDGVRQRGAMPEDRHVLDFLNGLTSLTAGGLDNALPWSPEWDGAVMGLSAGGLNPRLVFHGGPVQPPKKSDSPPPPKVAITPSSDWKTLLDTVIDPTTGQPYQPGGPSENDTTTSPACDVIEFSYPLRWRAAPKSGTSAGRGQIGFDFDVRLWYRNEPPFYLCSCCVFRQMISRFVFHNGAADLGNGGPKPDGKPGDRRYGGSRPDGSSSGINDEPGKEGGHIIGDCLLQFRDTPRASGIYGGKYNITFDFLGVVYDRCNNWALVAAKRMILHRSGSVVGGNYVDAPPASCHENVPPDYRHDGSKEASGSDIPGRNAEDKKVDSQEDMRKALEKDVEWGKKQGFRTRTN